MLIELAVRDLALIDKARISLAPGFTVITGETGAGKSLLIDALSLVMGGRADSSLIRHGADAARVEALFDREPERSAEPASEPIICVREVTTGGRSVARIDDETVTAGRLAALVGPLVEIHGQHEQQRLLQAGWQRDVLDAFGGHGEVRAKVAEAVQQMRANEAALRELSLEPAELERRLELAGHAAQEIDAARLREGELGELRSKLAVAANSERIGWLMADAHHGLAEEGSGARDRLALAYRSAAELARLDSSLEPLAERLAGLEAEADDLALELRRRLDAFSEEAADVSAIEERIGLIYELLRKYGEDEAAVLAHGERARAEGERLRTLEDERVRRTAEATRLRELAYAAAEELTAARTTTAQGLSAASSERLVELGFPGSSFSVALEPSGLDEAGGDSVAFLLAPNPGEPARPLSRVASGGELSRVALALKVVLARADLTPTLVFDEVDAGIGGRSADPVGASLWQLARDHQVICVTHLPQIAAHADVHLRIEKLVRDGRTVTAVRGLAGEERETELAQMLGGSAADAGALAAARELLERASRLRRAPSKVA